MLKHFIYCLLTVIPLFTLAQSRVCEGNLGENIFGEGDFGSGTDNIVQTDPGIAPGYSYNRGTPPNDGTYNLTNDMRRWSNNYGTWLQISDNSSDPNGYMMVVNASFSPGLFYDQEVEGLCENTLYEFSADVINLIQRAVTDHIKPNVSFLIDGEEQFTTGEIPQDERWHTYGFTFTTMPGQTSVQLSLRNNAPGGIGNDLALDNISFRPCGPEAFILPDEIANICEDGSPIDLDATVQGDEYATPAYQWQRSPDGGFSWQNIPGANDPVYKHAELSSGYYYYRYLLANDPVNLQNPKCRVNSNEKIVYVVPKFWDIRDTLCEGLSYEQGGNSYTRTGVYVDTLLSTIGCDSIVTLDLTILPDANIRATVNKLDPSCHDSSDGLISVDNVVSGTPPYVFALSGFPLSGSGIFPGLAAGAYDLEITDLYGCTYGEQVSIVAPPEFTVDLGPDLEIVLGDEVLLRPVANLPVDTFYWDPPDVVDCVVDCTVAIWFPLNSMDLRLRAVSDRGCEAEDGVSVRVDRQRKVFFPNAFSPNGDGVNDLFTVFGDQPNVKGIKRLMVFDRWGSLLFERLDFLPNNPDAGWNGSSRGQAMPEGVYVYVAEVEFFDGQVIRYAGDISLMR